MNKFYSEDMPKPLAEGEIEEIIDNFVKAIERAKRAGFDGVQLHAAHGYLLSEFLSPYSNHRQDQWGGTTENRFRIIGEIYDRARRVVGDYPLLVKLNAYDGRKGGMRVDEALRVARLLEESGCAAIEVSCGTTEDGMYMTRGPKLPIDATLRPHVQIQVTAFLAEKSHEALRKPHLPSGEAARKLQCGRQPKP